MRRAWLNVDLFDFDLLLMTVRGRPNCTDDSAVAAVEVAVGSVPDVHVWVEGPPEVVVPVPVCVPDPVVWEGVPPDCSVSGMVGAAGSVGCAAVGRPLFDLVNTILTVATPKVVSMKASFFENPARIDQIMYRLYGT